MDKLAKYQEYVKTLLTNYASDDVSDNDVEVQLILDTERTQSLSIDEYRLARIKSYLSMRDAF